MAQNHRIRPSKSYRVFIGGLPRETTLKDVEIFFQKFARRFDVSLKDGYGFIVSSNIKLLDEYMTFRIVSI